MEKLLVAVADNKPEAVVVEHVKPEPGMQSAGSQPSASLLENKWQDCNQRDGRTRLNWQS